MSLCASSERLRVDLSPSRPPALPDISALPHSRACEPAFSRGAMPGTSVRRFQSRQGTVLSGIGDQLALSVESRRREAAERDPCFAQPGLEPAIVPVL